MLKLFYEIYEERKILDETGEYVVCVDCGKRIYHDYVSHWNFSHDYGKNSHPEFKYSKKHIKIRCVKCHQKRDHGLNLKVHFNN